MCRVPRSRGPTMTHAHQALPLLCLLLLMQTNAQELPEAVTELNEINTLMLKENMEAMRAQIGTMQTSLTEMKMDIQILRKFNNIPGTGHEHFENISCPDNFVAINTTGECILIGNTYVTHNEASDRCESIGAHLVIPKDLRLLGDFLKGREFNLSDVFWVGADDQLTPKLWRWVDGTPVDAHTLIYSWKRLNQSPTPTRPGNQCGVLSLGLSDILDARRCNDLRRCYYLCEVEPGSMSTDIEFSLDTICPESFSQLSTGECVYISRVDESEPYTEANKVCNSHGARLITPEDMTVLLTFLNDQGFLEDYGFWLNRRILYNTQSEIGKKWVDIRNDTIQNLGIEYAESGYGFLHLPKICPMLKARPTTNDFDNMEVTICSSSHRFICEVCIYTQDSYNSYEMGCPH